MLPHFIERKALAASLFVSFLFGSTTAATSKDLANTQSHALFKASSARLSPAVRPSNYKLFFHPDLVKAVFDGDEDITLTVASAQSCLILNSADSTVERAQITNVRTGKTFKSLRVAYDKEAEQVAISFNSALSPGSYVFRSHFKGVLNDKLRGFYRSTFHDSHGDHFIATTQLEAADARRMFPCFDEPSFKSTFDISCLVDSTLEAISNAGIASVTLQHPEADGSTRKLVTFAQSPKMSSYLVALVVGPFVASKAVTVEGIPIRVWSIGEKSDQLHYASKAAANLLPFLNEYFGVRYPDSKLDLIAIPDFQAGAMENLGAITFRETALLYDEKDGSVEGQMRVMGTVAHEMAHMWFGDLVTMSWWDDLWLNEGFATWMASKAVNEIKPEWHQWDRFTDSREDALKNDSLRVSRPIHANVASAADADEMFDSITYEKGASVMRMLEKFVGEDNFRNGIRLYMSKHKYGNATKSDLWDALSRSSHRNIEKLMRDWTEKPGYPLVALTPSPNENNSVSQNRFLFVSEKNSSKQSLPTVWQVPLVLSSIGGDRKSVPLLLESPIENLSGPTVTALTGSPKISLFLNAGGNGYFRTTYTSEQLSYFSKNLQIMSVPERVSLLADTWTLVIAGKAKVESFLKLAEAARNEDNPYVEQLLIDSYEELERISDESTSQSLSKFICSQLLPLKTKFGWSDKNDEPAIKDMRQILREQILITLGTIGGDSPTIEEARQLFQTYLVTPDRVEPGVLQSITKIVAFNGALSEYESMLNIYRDAKSPEVRQRNLEALMFFGSPELQTRTLKMTLTDDIRTQDAPRLIQSALKNKRSQRLAWQFVKDNWVAINRRFPESMVRKMMKSAENFHTEVMQADLKQFVSQHHIAHAERSMNEMLEFVRVNVLFAKRTAPGLKSVLQVLNNTKEQIQIEK